MSRKTKKTKKTISRLPQPAPRVLRPRLRLDTVKNPSLKADLDGIVDILKYRRSPGTKSHDQFCTHVLEPIFGAPDQYGNYVHVIGENPTTAFLAHHDTVEHTSGRTRLHVDTGLTISLDPSDKVSSCLGADDGAGIWIILEMIRHEVPGLYVVFADEEMGCFGSAGFAMSEYGQWLLQGVETAISFDRHCMQGPQVITHMCGSRTASDTFAHALIDQLALPGFHPSAKGSITDSRELIGVGDVCEVTNVSVGYYDHHTPDEQLDFAFLRRLRDAVVKVDWDRLPIDMDPHAGVTGPSYAMFDDDARFFGHGPSSNTVHGDALMNIVQMYPDRVADLLEHFGYDAASLRDDLNL